MNISKRKFSAPLMMRVRSLPAYLADGSVSIFKKLGLLLAVIYVISPVDFVPDFIPVFGWLDDLGVIGIVFTALMKELDQYVIERKQITS